MERNLKKRWLLLIVSLAAVLALSACGSRLGANSWPGVSVDEETVYVAAGPAVYALNAKTGVFRWAFRGEGKSFSAYAAPAVAPDHSVVVVGDYSGALYGLSGGDLLWKFSGAQSHYVASPLVTQDAIYAPNADGSLYALDLKGHQKWVFRADGQPLWGTPAFDGTRLYVPSLGHHLYAVNAADGSLVWDVDLGGALASQPTLVDGVLYVGTFANDVVALNAEDGKVLWKAKTAGWVWSAPAYADGMLYVGDITGKFFALRAQDGETAWTESPDGAIVGRPLVMDGTVYFTTENNLVLAFTPDGKPLWQHTVQGKLYASPVAGDGLVFVAPYKGDELVLAFTPDGKTQWTLSVKDAEAALKTATEQK
ncbi:MAG TPA: hypothetical protein ENJ54_11155 [Chloroflexi bacterium]|nr:hypothetical protein [Chloroflexota bacterium]